MVYQPSTGLSGPGNADFTDANNWATRPVSEGGGGFDANNFVKNGTTGCSIKNHEGKWIDCTWHHHEDGKTLIPVPIEIHNRTNASHIGGVQIINNRIEGFFDSPDFN